MVREVFERAAHQRDIDLGFGATGLAYHLCGVALRDMFKADDQLAEEAILFPPCDAGGAAPGDEFGIALDIDYQRIKLFGAIGADPYFRMAWHG